MEGTDSSSFLKMALAEELLFGVLYNMEGLDEYQK